MRKIMTFGIPVIIIVVALLVAMIMVRGKDTPERRHTPKRGINVQVEVAEPSTLKSEIRAYGTLKSARELDLVAEVAGLLEEGDLPFLPGQSFREGQVILRVDERSIRYRLAQLKSAFMSNLARLLPELEIDFSEEAGPWRNYFAAFEIDGAMDELPAAHSEKLKLYLARYNIYLGFYDIRAQELLLSKATLRAPFDGVIANTNLRVGSSAMMGGKLGRILGSGDLEIEVALPSGEVAWLDDQAPVAISGSGGNWSGKVLRFGGEIDAATQTLPVFVSLNGAASAPPIGSFLEVRFPTRSVNSAMRIPRSALHGSNEVFIIEDARLALRQVEIARHEDDTVILSSGISAGDSLVVQALEGVIPGMPAQARESRLGGGR